MASEKKRGIPVALSWTLGFLTGASRNQMARHSPWKRRHRKVGNNEPCPCGSGDKYKNCHGTVEAREEAARRHRVDMDSRMGDRYV